MNSQKCHSFENRNKPIENENFLSKEQYLSGLNVREKHKCIKKKLRARIPWKLFYETIYCQELKSFRKNYHSDWILELLKQLKLQQLHYKQKNQSTSQDLAIASDILTKNFSFALFFSPQKFAEKTANRHLWKPNCCFRFFFASYQRNFLHWVLQFPNPRTYQDELQ